MTDSQIETTIGLCVVALTKCIMKKKEINHEDAYRYLLNMELYSLLLEPETRLFLETNDYLCTACEIEMDKGIDEMYNYINEDL